MKDTEHQETAMTDKLHFTAYDLLKKGGSWLGAARSRIKSMKCYGNGERVTWGSNDIIEPHMTIGQVEEIAAEAAAAAFTERAEMEEQIKSMRERYFRYSYELTCQRECAVKIAQQLLEVLQSASAPDGGAGSYGSPGGAQIAIILKKARETLDKMLKPEVEAPAEAT